MEMPITATASPNTPLARPALTMEERRDEALMLLGDAFVYLRMWARRAPSDMGRSYMFAIADAAHNIPDALMGRNGVDQYLDKDVEHLKKLVRTPEAFRRLEDLAPHVNLQYHDEVVPTGVKPIVVLVLGSVLFAAGILLGKCFL